jgi:excisionase family DNA binding protein
MPAAPEPRLTTPDLSPPLIYGVDEAARMLSISRASLYNLFDAGTLQRVKIGKRAGVTAAELQRFVATLAT